MEITAPAPGQVFRTSKVTIEWSGEDEHGELHHYDISIGNNTWRNVALNTSHTFSDLGDGFYTVEVRATDMAGNDASDTVDFTVNTSPIGGPGMTEETFIASIAVLIVVSIVSYLIKKRKN